ncbi:Peroxidasin [Araneus ventricosus]|uniref:Peroxidasin n=1 Tax=Araneus ventricosus TaxID=182803 RepID=A0A4Y2DHL1_ARAVE|nr:Peroxidasin [Araneus ventricosus]
METEASPLLRNISNISERKHFCRRIPKEIIVTATVLGLFLVGVTLLIVVENAKSTPKDEITLDSNLLGSPMKYKKKFSDKSWKENDTDSDEKKYIKKQLDKVKDWIQEWNETSENDTKAKDEKYIHRKLDKVKSWLEDWKQAYNVDNYQDALETLIDSEKDLLDLLKKFQDASDKPLSENDLSEILQDTYMRTSTEEPKLLGSPFKYNKKSFDKTWQDKKAKYVKPNKEYNKENYDINGQIKPKVHPLENFLKSSDKSSDASINLLGSSFKYNKKDVNKEWQIKKDLDNNKWDNVNKGYKKIYPLGSSASNTNALDKDWFSSDEAGVQYSSKKFDDVDKGFKKHNKSGDEILKELQEFYEAWKIAEKRVKYEKNRDYEVQKEISRNCTHVSGGSAAAPSGCPFANLLQSPAVPQAQVNCAVMAEQVRLELGRCIDMSFLPKECKPSWRTKCFSAYKYRKIDGTCSNQIHPTWGKSGTPFVRMVAPDYSDGVSSIRTSKDGSSLPNPRFLSQKLYSKKIKPDSDVTLLFTSFGLIVDHDMVETAINTDGIPCCSEKFDMYPESRPRECLQIDVPDGDPFYGPRNVKCLNFVRSVPVHGECGGRREQLNKATSFLDASAVYGSTIDRTKTLRSFNKGQLRTQRINNTPYMTSSSSSGYSCGTPSEPLKCFEAGDSRVNMLVELTAMHTLWYREHNRIAEELHNINPQWTDETLFQEARRILIGELQHITYSEFLPLLLGKEAMNYFQLNIEKDEFYDGYDETIDPSVYNVFGAAAFRFGHSLIKDMIDLIGPDNKSEASVALHETYFNPQILYHKGLDSLLRGATKQKLNSVDSFISPEVREHLFQPADKDYGHDLAAVGIQRGRDHGLPSYNKWRSVCGLSQMKSWDDLKSVMNVERAEKLKEVYKFVDDIDLIPGALAEDHVEGSLLGPTYLCIIGRQFKKTRKGDRFWFEMEDSVGSFTKDQLNELYNSNMARIICDNSDGITKIQKNVFKPPSATNPVVSCEDIPKVDLSKWKVYY